MNKTTYWIDGQIKTFAKEIKASPAGSAWQFLVPEIRHAVVSAKVLTIIRLQARETVAVEAIDDLYARLHEAMGTEL